MERQLLAACTPCQDGEEIMGVLTPGVRTTSSPTLGLFYALILSYVG